MKDEWTFEKAKKNWKQMTKAVEHIGVPGYQWQTSVLWDGSLLFGPKIPNSKHKKILMQKETSPLGNHQLHLAIGYGDPIRFLDRKGEGNPAIQRGLEEGRLPIPHIEMKDGNFIWSETVFAHLDQRNLQNGMEPRPNDLLVVHARFKVRNTSHSSNIAHLWLHFGNRNDVRLCYKVVVSANPNHLSHRFKAPFGILENKVRYIIPPPNKGRLLWHNELTPPEGMETPLRNVIEWQVPLPPEKEAELRIIIPYGQIDKTNAERLLNLNTTALQDDVKLFWKDVMERSSVIITPDSFFNDYAAAVVGQMGQQVAYRHNGKVWMYKTGPNHYELYWPCNAAKALPTFDLRGLFHFSRPVLQSFIETQSDDVGALTSDHRPGSTGDVSGEGFKKIHGFMGNFDYWTANTLIFSHGLELWALAAHYRITRDDEWLGKGSGSPLQAMLDACDWISAQRRRTMREERGEKVRHWGLLPAAAAHDWLSGNVIQNDTACIFGMAEVVRLLREIEHPRTEEIYTELNNYRESLRESFKLACERAKPLPMPDGTNIPFIPRDPYELNWQNIDWTYTTWGPLRAGAWGALDPKDELVEQTLEFLKAGMPKGEGFYLKSSKETGRKIKGYPEETADSNWQDVADPESPRHFLWKHYVEYETMWPVAFDLFLQRDDISGFLEAFFNNMAVAIHHEWLVGVESLDGVPSVAPGEGERWRALRNMFVNEHGGYDGSQQSLWLLQAIPRSWLQPGDHLSAIDMRTHFGGHIDLKVEVTEDGNSVIVSLKLDLKAKPSEIRIRLRIGNSRPLFSAEINGVKSEIIDRDLIKLPTNLKGNYQIKGFFQ